MESEHMVDGDGVDDDDGEDGIEISLSSVESKTNLKPEMKIVVVHHSILRKAPSFWPGWFLGYISTRKESARRHPRAKRALPVRPGVGPVPPALFPSMLIFGLPTSTHFFLLKIPKRVL
jgi:hypothetical protein